MHKICIMTGTRTFAISFGKVRLKENGFILRPLLLGSRICCCRSAHTQDLTSNIKYITNEKAKVTADPVTMRLNKNTDRPICIILNWLMMTEKLKMKYAGIYLDEGFDVVSVSIRPWQLMWPRKGSQVIGRDILKLMTANNNNYFVHGFSVGGYVWSEALVHAAKDLDRYQPVLDRVSAQVWDSVADITAVTAGVPLAVVPDRPLLQKTIKGLLEFYLFAFRNIATKHYKLASDTYYATPCKAPCLFLLSSTDHVGAEKNIRNACKQWREMGIKCTWQCWESSPHVQHFTKHKDDYLRLLRKHIHDNLPQLKQAAPACEADTRQKIRAVA